MLSEYHINVLERCSEAGRYYQKQLAATLAELSKNETRNLRNAVQPASHTDVPVSQWQQQRKNPKCDCRRGLSENDAVTSWD